MSPEAQAWRWEGRSEAVSVFGEEVVGLEQAAGRPDRSREIVAVEFAPASDIGRVGMRGGELAGQRPEAC